MTVTDDLPAKLWDEWSSTAAKILFWASLVILLPIVAWCVGIYVGTTLGKAERDGHYSAELAEPTRSFLEADPKAFSKVRVEETSGRSIVVSGRVREVEDLRRLERELNRLHGTEGMKRISLEIQASRR